MAIYALPGANSLQVATEVRQLMAKMSKTFPQGLKYSSLYDTTLFIGQAISARLQTLIIAGILVLHCHHAVSCRTSARCWYRRPLYRSRSSEPSRRWRCSASPST